MRAHLFTGGLLTLAAVLLVGLGASLDLDLEGVVLIGLAAGAALALVPDRDPLHRVGGFAVGFVLCWLAYVARAAVLPDSSAGRAAALAGIVVLGVVAGALLQLPLWSILLGAATLSGGYEAAFTLAPAEVADTSLAAVTAIVVTVGMGFLAGAASPAAAVRSPAERLGEVR